MSMPKGAVTMLPMTWFHSVILSSRNTTLTSVSSRIVTSARSKIEQEGAGADVALEVHDGGLCQGALGVFGGGNV